MYNTDLLSQSIMMSWGGELMPNIIVDGSYCHASLFPELSFPSALLGHSSQTPFVITLLEIPALMTRVRLPGNGGEGRRQ